MIRRASPIGRHQSARAQAVYWWEQGTVLGHRPIVRQCAHVDRGWETISVREGAVPAHRRTGVSRCYGYSGGGLSSSERLEYKCLEFVLERELVSAEGPI